MTSKRTPDPESPVPAAKPFPIVGIGASAGGLEAFTALLKHLPLDTGMAFVLVQHLDPQHDSVLGQILNRATSLPVREITADLRMEANHVYVITPNTNLGIAEGVLKVQPRPQTRLPHRPIDAFFEALAQDQRERAIGVVLSGTANDGTLGLEAIKAEGGITFAQDDSAKYDSMPRSAVAAGCVDFILSPGHIAQELARIATHPYIAGRPSAVFTDAEGDAAAATAREDDQSPLPSGGDEKTSRTGAQRARVEAEHGDKRSGSQREEDSYKKILRLLRNHCGVDFSLYKSSTIQRRVNRRLVLSKETTLGGYARFLRGNTQELDALYSDVLISVTSFFRNPEAFDTLQREVLPELFKQPGDDPLRAWVLGCSTGQEAYSLAIVFAEAAEKASCLRKLQVFATDLNEALLDKARQGLYAKNIDQDVTPERLRRFFVEEEGGYRVSKTLREMVVFARQNLINDPPFSRMDLISCRNLLIYLEPSLQKRAIPTFHYALKTGRFLLLGASESIGGFTELFEPMDKKHKIYVKKAAPISAFHLPLRREGTEHPLPSLPSLPMVREAVAEGLRGELNAQREADRIVVNRFGPPGVLINDALQVLQFRGPTGAYLEPPSGKPSFDVLKMAREGLMLALRAAINQARQENQAARKDNVRVKRNGETRVVNVEVIPLKNLQERCFLILFEEAGAAGERNRPSERQSAPARRLPRDEAARHIAELEAELGETRDYVQSMQEQHEAANEELQAANEEAQSANEELQSINEELETSKEELESSNEELATVNEEMVNRNIELNRLSNDLINLQSSTQLALVLLGRGLNIRRFSAQAGKQLGLLATDVGRPISHIRHNLVLGLDPDAGETSPLDLERLVDEVIANVRAAVREVRDTAGRWYSLRVHPYITLDNKMDGAVLVLVDIDDLVRSKQAAIRARDAAENTIETLPAPLLVLDSQLRVEHANRAFYRAFHVAPIETVGKFIYDLGNTQWNIPRLRELLEQILPQRGSVEDFEVEHNFEHLGRQTMLLNAVRNLDPVRNSERILLAITDITRRKRAEEELRESGQRYQTLFESMDQGYCVFEMLFDRDGKPADYRFVEINAAFEQQSGLHEALGKRMLELVPAHEAFWFEIYGKIALTGESLRFVNEAKALGRWFDVYAFRLGGPESRRVAALFTNITERKRIERALSESEEQFRTLVEQVQDFAIFRMDPTGRTTTWNTGVERILGFQETEFIGKDIVPAIFTPEDVENGVAARELEQAAAKGVANDDRWMRRKNGEHFFASGLTTALKDSNGKLIGFTKVMRDQTQRKRIELALQESELRYRRLFESAKDGILILEIQNMRITDANPLISELLGYSLKQFKGKELWEIGLFQDREQNLAAVGKLREEGYVHYEDLPLQSTNGKIYEVECICSVYQVDGHAVVQCNIRDITERKRMEQQIQRQAKELAETSRRKDEFLAMLSHELRNPMAPIFNALQLIEQDEGENVLQHETRGVIERQLRHMSRLVDDLLDISRITTGRIHLHTERVDVNDIIERAVERVRPLIDRRGQQLRLSLAQDTVWLDADPTRLEQVVGNLLDNASKYNSDGGRITLTVERSDRQAIIRVRDEGEGLAADTLLDIFELFTQAQRSLDRSQGGLGIGLALVKSLVKMHDGTVEAHSAGIGQGSEFVMRLPLAASQTLQPVCATAPPDAAIHASDLRVLVVDDNADAAKMSMRLLHSWGYDGRIAYDGAGALQEAAEFHPHVILLDIGLPSMDGYEVARLIRQDPRLKAARIVAVTGYGQDADRQRSKAAGFDDHLVKPVEPSTLKALLAGFLPPPT